MRGRRCAVLALSCLSTCLARQASAAGGDCNIDFTGLNTGSVTVNCNHETKQYVVPRDLDEQTIAKLVKATVKGVEGAWQDPLDAMFKGLAGLTSANREIIARLRGVDKQLADIEQRSAVTQDLLRSLNDNTTDMAVAQAKFAEVEAARWAQLSEGLRTMQSATDKGLDDLEKTIAARLQEVDRRYQQALDRVVGFNRPWRLVLLAPQVEPFDFVGLGVGVQASRILKSKNRFAFGLSVGGTFCCVAAESRKGGYALPPNGEIVEPLQYEPRRFSIEIGPELRIGLGPTWQLVGTPSYRATYLSWRGTTGPAGPSGWYHGVVVRLALDIKLTNWLVFGPDIAPAWNSRSVLPVWTYTGFAGTTSGPGSAAARFRWEGGIHVGLAIMP